MKKAVLIGVIMGMVGVALVVVVGYGAMNLSPEVPVVWAEDAGNFPYTTDYSSAEMQVSVPFSERYVRLGKYDNAPQASMFVADFLAAISEQNATVYLQMLGCQSDTLPLDAFDALLAEKTKIVQTVEGTHQEISLDSFCEESPMKFSSEYEGSDAVVTCHTKVDGRPATTEFNVHQNEDGSLVILGRGIYGILSDVTINIPGKGTINGVNYTGNRKSQDSSGEVYTFTDFPDIPVTTKYISTLGTSESTANIIDGVYKVEPLLDSSIDRTKYGVIANDLIQRLWKALEDNSISDVYQLLENHETAKQLITKWKDITGKKIDSIEIYSDELKAAEDCLVAGNVIRLHVKYMVKFDIEWNLKTTRCSCKDFTTIDLHVDDGGAWFISDMDINTRHSILTHLDASNNEW
ncbi:MAG: hypothetical protein RSC43_00235 [Clostridia bacterium]